MINWLSSTVGFLISLALIMAIAWPTREHAGFRVGHGGQVLRALAVLAVGTLASSALWCFGGYPAASDKSLLPALFAAFSFALSICLATVFMLRAQTEEAPAPPQSSKPNWTRSTHLLIIEESSGQ